MVLIVQQCDKLGEENVEILEDRCFPLSFSGLNTRLS